jgi:hypothetical protein
MRFQTALLAVLRELFGESTDRRTRRARFQPRGEALETINLQSALTSGATAPEPSHHKTGGVRIGSAEVYKLTMTPDGGTLDPGDPGGVELARSAGAIRLERVAL